MRLSVLTIVLLSAMMLGACEPAAETEVPAEPAAPVVEETLPEGDGTRENPYVGMGTVSEIGNGEVLIDHGPIPGWMPPMQMAFPVTDEVDLGTLEVGDRVRFNVEMGGDYGYQIFGLEQATP